MKGTFPDTTADITTPVNANGLRGISEGRNIAPRLPSLDETNPEFDFEFFDHGEDRQPGTTLKYERLGNGKSKLPSHPNIPASDGSAGDGLVGCGKEALESIPKQYLNIVESMVASDLASSSNAESHGGISAATNSSIGETDVRTRSGTSVTPYEAQALLSPREPSSDVSVHLYDMRISQHLRSLTSLSSSSSSDPTPGSTHGRNVSRSSLKSANTRWYDRPPSFKSHRVPSSWGKVLEQNRRSSSYSTLGTSLANVREADFSTDSPPGNRGNGGTQISKASEESEATRNWSPAEVSNIDGGTSSLGQSPSASSPTEPSSQQTRGTKSSARSVEKKKVKLGGEKVSRTLRALAHQNQRKRTVALDGPLEEQVESDAQGPSRDSIGGNYGEAAMVWQKALNAHEEQRMRRKSSVSPSSFRTAASQLLQGRTFTEPETSTDSPAIVEQHRNSLSFKPIEMEHSFDRLAVPGRTSVSQDTPLVLTREDTVKEGENTLYGRRKSASQQHLKTPVDAPRRSSPVEYHSASLATLDSLPEIKVTGAQSSKSQEPRLSKPFMASRRSDLDLVAWGRYPSHTRIERTLSAGIPDAVQPHDFGATESPVEDSDRPSGPLKDSHRPTHDFAKVRAKARRQILFRDWAARVKPYLVGFRKGETGHRSSIAVGGELEYPELELGALHSATEPTKMATPDANRNPGSINAGSARHRRSSSLQVNQYSNFKDYPKLDSSVKSSKSEHRNLSDANSSLDPFRPSAKTQSRSQLTVPKWEMEDLDFSPTLRHARTDEVSPLDGAYKQIERTRASESSTALLLPALGALHSRLDSANSENRGSSLSHRRLSRRASTGVVDDNQALRPPIPTKALSMEQMKSSTHSMWRFLDDADQLEVEKAMRVAEGSWEH